MTAWKTEVIRKNFVEFIHVITEVIRTVFVWSKTTGLFVAKLGEMIPQTIVVTIVHWVLLIIVCAGIMGGLGWLMVIVCKKYVNFFRKKQADEISVFVGLVTLAIVVYMANVIKSILSINLLFLAIIFFVGYTIVRGIVQSENTDVKMKILKYSGIVLGSIGAFVVMVHFFGGIAIIAIPIGCFLAANGN